ncbi:MAG: TRAP transporter small permease subunit [Cyclobacteriaceae bacterium]
MQIYARFFLASAPSWTEESARFFFVYAVSFAAGLAMKHNYFVHLDVLYSKMKEKYQRDVDIVISFSVLTLFGILGVFWVQYVILSIPESSPSLGLPIFIAFGSIVLMSLFITVYSISEVVTNLKKNQ